MKKIVKRDKNRKTIWDIDINSTNSKNGMTLKNRNKKIKNA